MSKKPSIATSLSDLRGMRQVLVRPLSRVKGGGRRCSESRIERRAPAAMIWHSLEIEMTVLSAWSLSDSVVGGLLIVLLLLI